MESGTKYRFLFLTSFCIHHIIDPMHNLLLRTATVCYYSVEVERLIVEQIHGPTGRIYVHG